VNSSEELRLLTKHKRDIEDRGGKILYRKPVVEEEKDGALMMRNPVRIEFLDNEGYIAWRDDIIQIMSRVSK